MMDANQKQARGKKRDDPQGHKVRQSGDRPTRLAEEIVETVKSMSLLAAQGLIGENKYLDTNLIG